MITVSIFDSSESLYEAALRLVLSVLTSDAAVPQALIISGGRTPKPLLDAIASMPPRCGPKVYIGYSDERHVPLDDPESNYGLSASMIQALQLPPERVLRIRTELPLDEAANAYHEAWVEFLDKGGQIPLALLGLGEDGHTCSLFSKSQLNGLSPERYAASVRRNEGLHRVTVTPALLEHVAHVVFLVVGEKKGRIVKSMLQEDNPPVAALAVQHVPRVSLWYSPKD